MSEVQRLLSLAFVLVWQMLDVFEDGLLNLIEHEAPSLLQMLGCNSISTASLTI